jgi:two-component system osmolarity sensor histidine kinase EnvZ
MKSLQRFYKQITPKTFLARSLTILITPLILVQLITGYVFWDRHWSKFTQRLSMEISHQISALMYLAKTTHDPQAVQLFAKKHFDMEVDFLPPFLGFSNTLPTQLGWRESIVATALNRYIQEPFRLKVRSTTIHIQISTLRGIVDIHLPRHHIFPKTTPIVIWWEVGAPIFFLIIAILFMRNQIRPLRSLADAVQAFGKGRDEGPLKPAGALEVRRVSQAFNEMRERIRRQVSQRTDMLSGISHDLRTPLTRMRLQLALLPESDETQSLLVDVQEMETMIKAYLDFAKGQESEPLESLDLIRLLEDIGQSYPPDQLFYEGPKETHLMRVRPLALRRLFQNVVGNALRYGTRAWLHVHETATHVMITVDDDGPGIPEADRDKVFRPFYRRESSRNIETGGYGLGLTIVKDVVTTHGGQITLSDSPQGGLRVMIKLPH